MKATINTTKKNYKALIAANPHTPAFFTVDAESPEKALQSIKATNKDWRDCTIWIEYNPTGQRVEKIANEWEII